MVTLNLMEIKEINQLKNEIEKILSDNKALDVKSIDLKDKTSIAFATATKKERNKL